MTDNSTYCSDCDQLLTADTVTVSGSTGEIEPVDALSFLAGTDNGSVAIVVECDRCGHAVSRSVTIRS